MHQPSKDHSSKRSKTKEMTDQEMIIDLAKCIVEILHDDGQSENEPFEQYAHQLRTRLHKDSKIFYNRFIRGYETLLEECLKK